MPGGVRPVRSRSNNRSVIPSDRSAGAGVGQGPPGVSYVDRPFGGVPMTIRWKKHLLICPNAESTQRTFTLTDHRIAAKGCMLTTRAAKWVVKQIGAGETISHLAQEFDCCWDAVNADLGDMGSGE
jgi:transposase